MDIYGKAHMLDSLDQLSVENLQAGRITCSAMAHAVRYAVKSDNFGRGSLGGCMGGSCSDRILADILNDMFEAAKFKMEEAEKIAGPRCVKCGRSFDDHDDEACPPGNKMLAVGQKRAYVVMANREKMLAYDVEPEGIAVWKLRSLALHSIEESGTDAALNYCQLLLTPDNSITISERDVVSAMRDYYRTRALKGRWDWLCNKCGQRFSNEQVHAARGSGTPACLNCGAEMICYKEAKPAGEEKAPEQAIKPEYRYRVVYRGGPGIPVEWLTNKIEPHDTGIKFQDHNGKTQICLSRYEVIDLMTDQPAAENECPGCHNGTLEREGSELRCRGECGGIFATCPNCGRVAPKYYGMVTCDGCGANWPKEQEAKIDKVPDTLHLKPKKQITLDDLKKVDWDLMAYDVNERIQLIADLAVAAEKTPLMDKITEDLILPNLRLLAEFCENVEIKEEP